VLSVCSGYRRDVDENYAFLRYYTADSGSFLPTFRENISVPYLWVEIGRIGCAETSVRNSHYSLRNNPEDPSSQLLILLFDLTTGTGLVPVTWRFIQ
jgi:hypothetical protein